MENEELMRAFSTKSSFIPVKEHTGLLKQFITTKNPKTEQNISMLLLPERHTKDQ